MENVKEYSNGEVTVVWKQQLCEHSGDPHGIREAHVQPPHPSKILPPNGPIFLELEFRFGEMFPWTLVQVCPWPSKKG